MAHYTLPITEPSFQGHWQVNFRGTNHLHNQTSGTERKWHQAGSKENRRDRVIDRNSADECLGPRGRMTAETGRENSPALFPHPVLPNKVPEGQACPSPCGPSPASVTAAPTLNTTAGKQTSQRGSAAGWAADFCREEPYFCYSTPSARSRRPGALGCALLQSMVACWGLRRGL